MIQSGSTLMMEGFSMFQKAVVAEKNNLEAARNEIREAQAAVDRKLALLDAKEAAFEAKVEKYDLNCVAMKTERMELDTEVIEKTMGDSSSGRNIASDIVDLNVAGTKISVLRETLCAVKGSKLATMFSGRWESSHRKGPDGLIFLDFDPAQFSVLLNLLRGHRMHGKDDGELKMPDETYAYMWDYFALAAPVEKDEEVHFKKSKILTDESLDKALFAMLPRDDGDRTEEPTLLYSVEGRVNQDAFHRMCDGRGRTVTVVLCTAGCIFGGYNPLSWTSENSYSSAIGTEFLFSLKNPNANTTPSKFPVIKGNRFAIWKYARHGPSFGYNLNCECLKPISATKFLCAHVQTICFN